VTKKSAAADVKNHFMRQRLFLVNYVSKKHHKATEQIQLIYSKKAYPHDNADIESFHSLLKRE